jgi:hypothetical protein
MNLLKKRYFDYFVALGVYFIISFLVLGIILTSPGTIGFFHDWSVGPYHEMNENWAEKGLYVWDSQIGNKIYYTDWIFQLSFLSIPFLGGEILSKGLLILCITLSGFGAFCLGKRLELNSYVSFTAGILYIFSPIIFTRIVAGYIYYLIGYFLSPLIVANFLKGREENNNRYFIIAGLLLSFAVIQLQFLIMIFLILLIFALVDFKRIKKSIIGLIIVVSITFLITFSPIILSQLVVNKTEIPFNPTQLLSYFTVETSSDLLESFRILGYKGMPYSYLNLGTSNDKPDSNSGVIPPWIFYLDFIIPIVGFSVLLFRRDKYTVSFAVISILGLYLLKGLNPPFPGVFAFLFAHGFYIFREVWHLAFLYGFSITFLVAFFIERLWKLSFKPLFKVSLSVALISLIVISNGYPLLLGNFAGYLQTYDFPSEYHTLYNKFSSDPHYNVLILPYVRPILYDNLRLEGIDPFISYTSPMIFPSDLGNRESPTLSASTWLLSSIQENKTQNLGKVLSGFGIEYVILRKDFVSNYPNYTPLGSLSSFKEKWYTPLEPILDAQTDMKIISDTAQYKIYENLNNATKIFAPTTSGGGLSDFDSLLSISNLTALSNVALYPSVSESDSLIFLDDIVETNMPVNDFVDIGKYVDTFDAQKGWTDTINSFGYDHLLASRVNKGAFTVSPNSEISFELPAKYNNKHVEIWMKALTWDQGGPITIKIDGQEHSPSLSSPDRSFRLFKIFEGESGVPYNVSIQNIQGKNYVEGLYVREKGLQHLSTSNKIIPTSIENQTAPNLIANSDFSIVDNQSGLPLYWNDSLKRCDRYFNCKVNGTDGWDGRQSLQFFTKYPHNISDIWSSTYGQQIEVKQNERYELITHMKLNKWATESHVALEGFNEISKQWYQITKCPANLNGPIRWEQFSCVITIPENTTKVRPVLNAGWSPELKKGSKTWFDALSLTKLKDENESPNLAQIKKLILPEIGGNNNKSSSTITTNIKEFNKVNPTLWNVHISTSKPATIGFAEPYDQSWEATVYKDGIKIDVVKSMPLYGAINAFQIKQTGNLDIVLSFAPQYWYQVGFVVSGITIAFCIFYIIYDWRRNKERKSSSSSVSSPV